MSKLEAQRAMRAARYDAARAASNARTPSPGAEPSTAPPVRPASTRTRSKAAPAPLEPDLPGVELCGHRSSIGGKACRRPAGHAETTHRYA